MRALRCLLIALVPTLCAAAVDAGKDPAAILEIGGAMSRSFGGESSYGPSAAIEVTPIEHWLELELGVTPLFQRHHSAEWNVDLLFKKPWSVTPKFEFMAGLGPEWVHRKEAGIGRNSISIEAAADFMIWPGPVRRFGFFVEPVYEVSLARGHEKSVGVSAGLLIAMR